MNQSQTAEQRPVGLSALFAPRSVAVVGATGNPASLFARPVSYLNEYGFAGEIYPVNPKYSEIGGRPCYPSLKAIEAPVDLVLVMVPAATVERVIVECGETGAAVAIVFSSGFAESNEEGAELQRRLADVARDAGVRVVGPNCQGIIVTPAAMAATFTGSIVDRMPESDGLAYIGQSGAVGGCLIDLAADHGVGVSAWLSIGNQVDVELFEAALEMVEMPDVRVLAAYVESVEDGTAYQRLATRCAELGKPLVLLRPCRTPSGVRASAAHTGGRFPPDEAFDALARRTGAILVNDIDELVDVSCSLLRFGGGHGKNVAVVTASGGAGGIAADYLTLAGLAVPELPLAVQTQLAQVVPQFGAVRNPVDVTFQLFVGGTADFSAICAQLCALEEIDQVVVVMTAIGGDAASAVADGLVRTAAQVDKPLHYGYLVGHAQTSAAREILRRGKLPAFNSLARVGMVAAALAEAPGNSGVSA